METIANDELAHNPQLLSLLPPTAQQTRQARRLYIGNVPPVSLKYHFYFKKSIVKPIPRSGFFVILTFYIPSLKHVINLPFQCSSIHPSIVHSGRERICTYGVFQQDNGGRTGHCDGGKANFEC
jgi:hypothetical protein